METKEITWKIAARVWWSLAWRSMLFIMPTAFIFGGIIGFFMAMFKIPIEPNTLYLQIIGGLIAVLMGIWIIKTLLSKSYTNFKIVVLPVDNEEHNT